MEAAVKASRNGMLKLYRGISATWDRAEKIAEDIRRHGLQPSPEGSWKISLPLPNTVRANAPKLRNAPSEIPDLIHQMPKAQAVNACGDSYGASYYALHHYASDKKNVGILIELELPVETLIVDGRDWLAAVFQLWDRTTCQHKELVRAFLKRMFGKGLLPYFDEASQTKDQRARIGLCDLARHDLDVIAKHAKNKILMMGRENTEFFSAFFVHYPVEAAAVKEARVIRDMPELRANEMVRLQDMLSGTIREDKA